MSEIKPKTIEEIKELIHDGKCVDPLLFLESLVNGRDLRELSKIYLLIRDIEELAEGQPTKEEWSDVVDLVMTSYRYAEVPLKQSIDAAKTLAEYLHPKHERKQSGINSGENEQHVTKLTEEEIILFKERFNDEF